MAMINAAMELDAEAERGDSRQTASQRKHAERAMQSYKALDRLGGVDAVADEILGRYGLN